MLLFPEKMEYKIRKKMQENGQCEFNRTLKNNVDLKLDSEFPIRNAREREREVKIESVKAREKKIGGPSLLISNNRKNWFPRVYLPAVAS